MNLLDKLKAEAREQKQNREPVAYRPPIANMTIAKTERDQAIQQVHDNSDEAWRERALEAVKRCAEARADFISDDVWEFGLDRTREDRALGPVFLKAARLGWMTKTDRVRPSVRSHLSGKPVWSSNLYRESEAA